MNTVTGEVFKGDIQEQARIVFENIRAVLDAGGSSMAEVDKVNIYLTDIKDMPAVNKEYERHFSKPYPARACVQVSALPLGVSIEAECVAYVDESK